MKKSFLLTGLLIIVISFSCKKEERLKDHKPPIAHAGPDKTIILPADSILLDGSASSDPDGAIKEWKWTKMSGPASVNIINAAMAKTIVRDLDTGIYTFELMVKDSDGLLAMDTIQITVNHPSQINQPPVANAGANQTITLPINTISLDGSASSDPNNNIGSYLWSKIAGPASFNIANVHAVQTQITNLVQGVYLFELRVTDNEFLFSKDTTRVEVIPMPPCDNSNRPIVDAQLIPMATLSGFPWAVTSFGNKVAFISSDTIEIFDLTLNTWSAVPLNLSQTRTCCMAVIGAGNKIFFAGGEYASLMSIDVVDIYDISTNTWTVSNLSTVGESLSTASCGNKVFFGGSNSNVVDIYDLTSNSWSTAPLSVPRYWMTAVSGTNKVYFTGGVSPTGQASNVIDIYDNSTNTWSTATMNVSRLNHAGVELDDVLFFAGGFNPNSCSAESLNPMTGDRTLMELFTPGFWYYGQTALVKNSKIVFPRLYGGINANKFDIYDAQTNVWSIGVLPQPLPSGAIAFSKNNILYIVGGNQNTQLWKLQF